MGMFSALDTSASGTKVSRIWLDAISDNVANVNTVRPFEEDPFRARLVMAQSYEIGDDRGVGVSGVVADDSPYEHLHVLYLLTREDGRLGIKVMIELAAAAAPRDADRDAS